MNFAKIFRTPFLKNTSGRLLLTDLQKKSSFLKISTYLNRLILAIYFQIKVSCRVRVAYLKE